MIEDAEFDRVELAIKAGDLLSVREWLTAGGDADLSNRFGWTLVMVAAMHGQTRIVRLLVSSGANLFAQNQFGDFALQLAHEKGHLNTARVIRELSTVYGGASGSA